MKWITARIRLIKLKYKIGFMPIWNRLLYCYWLLYYYISVVYLTGHRHFSDSSTEDLVNLVCSVEFHGNWAPRMEWKEHSIDGDKVLSVDINITTASNRVSSTLVIPFQIGSREYTCTIKFNISDKPRNTTATNVPEDIRVHTFTKSHGILVQLCYQLCLHPWKFQIILHKGYKFCNGFSGC